MIRGGGVLAFRLPGREHLHRFLKASSLIVPATSDAVLAPTEFGVASAGLLRSSYGIDGMGFETAHAFANKYVMKKKLASAGVPVAPFRPVHRLADLPSAADELGWPRGH